MHLQGNFNWTKSSKLNICPSGPFNPVAALSQVYQVLQRLVAVLEFLLPHRSFSLISVSQYLNYRKYNWGSFWGGPFSYNYRCFYSPHRWNLDISSVSMNAICQLHCMLKLEVQKIMLYFLGKSSSKAFTQLFRHTLRNTFQWEMSCLLNYLLEVKKPPKQQAKQEWQTPPPTKYNPNKPTATKIQFPLHMGLNPNCKAELCKLGETCWNKSDNPSLASGLGAPSQTYRSMLVKERLVKGDGSDGPPEGRVWKLKRGDRHTRGLGPESSSVPEFLGSWNHACKCSVFLRTILGRS